MNNKQGWINLYKPKNITSFKAINSVKKKFSINNYLHARNAFFKYKSQKG